MFCPRAKDFRWPELTLSRRAYFSRVTICFLAYPSITQASLPRCFSLCCRTFYVHRSRTRFHLRYILISAFHALIISLIDALNVLLEFYSSQNVQNTYPYLSSIITVWLFLEIQVDRHLTPGTRFLHRLHPSRTYMCRAYRTSVMPIILLPMKVWEEHLSHPMVVTHPGEDFLVKLFPHKMKQNDWILISIPSDYLSDVYYTILLDPKTMNKIARISTLTHTSQSPRGPAASSRSGFLIVAGTMVGASGAKLDSVDVNQFVMSGSRSDNVL